MYSDPQKFINYMSDTFIEKGLPISGGWASYKMLVMPKEAGAVQLEETRKAFFAGAQHLYSMIMHGLTEGSEPTETDLKRMQNIETELAAFASAFMRERDGVRGKDN